MKVQKKVTAVEKKLRAMTKADLVKWAMRRDSDLRIERSAHRETARFLGTTTGMLSEAHRAAGIAEPAPEHVQSAKYAEPAKAG